MSENFDNISALADAQRHSFATGVVTGLEAAAAYHGGRYAYEGTKRYFGSKTIGAHLRSLFVGVVLVGAFVVLMVLLQLTLFGHFGS